jgi:hypothetical protein
VFVSTTNRKPTRRVRIGRVLGAVLAAVVAGTYLLYNHITWGSAQPPPPPPPPTIHTIVTGSETHTWRNANADGEEGQTIPKFSRVQVSCRLQGYPVPGNRNDWWYRIASPPWNNKFYASADAFYNNGQTSGPLEGGPWVDETVPMC